MNYITTVVNVQVGITIFVSLAIELVKGVYTGLDLAMPLGETGMLELHLESSHKKRRSLICLRRVDIYHQKSHLVVLMGGKHLRMMIHRIAYKAVLSVQIA